MMQIPAGKKIYFLSDFHLGTPHKNASLDRERKIVRFLESVRHEAAAFFILGDMFDFWYEYKKVVPKGYARLMGTLASITDSGIPVHFFVGNHDMWMRDYFQTELGIRVYHEPAKFSISEKNFFIGHGDGLGPGDHGYKLLKKIFRNPFCRWAFGMIPPAVGMGIADYFSRRSRIATGTSEDQFLGEDKEWLVAYCRKKMLTESCDYFVFGHRHLPIDFPLDATSRYINLGDWLKYDSYAVFDGTNLTLHTGWQA